MKALLVGMAMLFPLNALAQAPLGPPAAGGKPIIEITPAGFQALPLAVPNIKVLKGGAPGADANPLANDPVGDAATQLTKVLRDDLSLSGAFKVLDPAGYLPSAQKEGLVVGTFNAGDWINIGATGLLKVGLARVGTDTTLEAHLFDVARGHELMNVKFSGAK
jgi:TolB protein